MVNAVVTSNEGFYVGDICYALPDSVYYGVWGENEYKDGSYEVNGYEFAVASTAFGDGTYYDNLSREYFVDAGVLGVVPLELVDPNKDLDGGHVFHFSGCCEFESDEGVFDIDFERGGSIHINTADDEDEEDEDYDEDDEDESEDDEDEYEDEDSDDFN